VEKMTSKARDCVAECESEKKTLARMLDQLRRTRILPDEAQLEKVRRYEWHLERALYKAMHELQRLQAARQGQLVPAPVAVDVSVDGAASGE